MSSYGREFCDDEGNCNTGYLLAAEFHEHGRFIYSQPYDETIAVPLFIKFPGSWAASTRGEEVVETRDILATVLVHLGIDPPESAQGERAEGVDRDPLSAEERERLEPLGYVN